MRRHTMLLDGDNIRIGLNKNLGFTEADRVEKYVSTPIEECERRDVKGLYKKVRNGEIPNFTGITSPYEVPENPNLIINTKEMALEEAMSLQIEKLEENERNSV